MYDMYPRTWGESRLDDPAGETAAAEREQPAPRRRPRRQHSVAPRVRTTRPS